MSVMNRGTIKRLNGDAARLLLVLLTCDGTETLSDLPMLIEMAGLSHTCNSHGKNRYARAFQQLKDLHFIEVKDGSICVLFEELLGLGTRASHATHSFDTEVRQRGESVAGPWDACFSSGRIEDAPRNPSDTIIA